jgi:hypothetical protein
MRWTKRALVRWIYASLLWVAVSPTGLFAQGAEGQPDKEPAKTADVKVTARLGTYEKPTGEIFYALGLRPTKQLAAPGGVDMVVLIDTSASQTGLFRQDGFITLRGLVDSLTEKDLVQLVAIDVKPKPLTDGLTGAKGEEIRAAYKKLVARTPLGSTNLPAGLILATKTLASSKPDRARAVVYIGDGLSRANFVTTKEMRELITELAAARVSVYSYAIGPARDVEFLAALGNHTGGGVMLDSEGSEVAQLAGSAIARAARRPVYWPLEFTVDGGFETWLPDPAPPLRTDRDSIVLGKLKERGRREVRGVYQVGAEKIELNDEFNFLPQIIESAENDGGARLPTVGSEGLREVGRMIRSDAQTLVKLGIQALKRDDLKAAESAVNAVLKRDPDNPDAHALKRALEKKKAAQEALKNPADNPVNKLNQP